MFSKENYNLKNSNCQVKIQKKMKKFKPPKMKLNYFIFISVFLFAVFYYLSLGTVAEKMTVPWWTLFIPWFFVLIFFIAWRWNKHKLSISPTSEQKPRKRIKKYEE